MRVSRDRGFTLVELLVVIAIVGVLIGILIPAVNMVRESARRTSCLNKMRQMSLASLSFESAMGHLPSGINSKSDQRFPRMTWLTKLLPHVEQNGIWGIAIEDYDSNRFLVGQHAGLKTLVPLFSCPSSDRASSLNWTHEQRLVACTNYLGVNGTNFERKDGVFFLNSRMPLARIKDGLSNTFLVGERPPSNDFWYGWWYVGEGRDGSGSPDMILGVNEINVPDSDGMPTYLEDCGSGPFQFGPEEGMQCDTLHFWSNHPSGGNFALCDGSVHWVPYVTDAVTIQALSTRNGGEPVSLE